MKTNMRRLSAWILALILISADFCAVADELSTIILPKALKSIEAEAFYGNTSIERVVVPAGTTEVGSKAFANSSLIEIELPESLESISDDAFEGVTDVTVAAPEGSYAYNWAITHGYISSEFTPEENFTYFKKDGEVIIAGYIGCDEIVNVPSTIQNSPVVGIDKNAFEENTLITKVVLPNSLRSIGDFAFVGCSNLQHIVMPDSISYIGVGSFSWCESLEYVVLPDQLEVLGDSSFYGCSSLCEIILPSSMKDLGYGTFGECSSLSEIIIPEGVSELKNELFLECSSLYEIILPESLTTLGDSVFYRCESLDSITIPASVSSIDTGCFANCFSLESILVEDGNEHYCSINGVLFTADKKELISYPCGKHTSHYLIPDGTETIADAAFFGIQNISRIAIPESMVQIHGSAIYSPNDLIINIYSKDIHLQYDSFYSEGELLIRGYANSTAQEYAQAYEIPFEIIAENSTSVEDFEYEIEQNEVIITGYIGTSGMVVVPATIEGYPVTKIGDSAFECCEHLETLDIPYGVKSIGAFAFSECKSLVRVSLPDSLTEIGEGVFLYCDSLPEIELPDSVVSIGAFAFSECKSLVRVSLPNNLTEIGEGTFCCCYSLSEIKLPDGLTAIGDEAFSDCALTEIILPDSVVSIGGLAFAWNRISNVTLPENLSYIGGLERNMDAFLYNEIANINVHEDNAVFSSIDGVLFTKDQETLLLYPIDKTQSSYTVPKGVKEIAKEAFAIPGLLIEDEEGRHLKTVQLPESLTTICESAFQWQDELSEINFPEGLTSIGPYAFDSCHSLKNITIPSSMRTIGESAFEYSGLTDVNMLNGVISIEDNAFCGCDFASISIPASVVSLEDGVFDDCYDLTEINVDSGNKCFASENGVLFNKDITTLLLYPKNKASKQYTVPSSVVSIAPLAFCYCDNLERIILSSSLTHVDDNAFLFWDDPTFYVIEGSYAHDWCKEHEIPFSFHIWASGTSTPSGTLYQGDYFTLYGYVHAIDRINSIIGKIYSFDDSKVLQQITINPGTASYNLNGKYNYSLKFGTLTPGDYVYELVASSNEETKVLSHSEFTIVTTPLRIGINGGNIPKGLIDVSNGFSFEGEIISNHVISSLTVEFYYTAASGEKCHTNTVNPNTLTYSLANLTDMIPVASLPIGEYSIRIIATANGEERILADNTFHPVKLDGEIDEKTLEAVAKFVSDPSNKFIFSSGYVDAPLQQMNADEIMLMAINSRDSWLYGVVSKLFTEKKENLYLVELYESELASIISDLNPKTLVFENINDAQKDFADAILDFELGIFDVYKQNQIDKWNFKDSEVESAFIEHLESDFEEVTYTLEELKKGLKGITMSVDLANDIANGFCNYLNGIEILAMVSDSMSGNNTPEFKTAVMRLYSKYKSESLNILLNSLDVFIEELINWSTGEIVGAMVSLGSQINAQVNGATLYSIVNFAIDLSMRITGLSGVAENYQTYVIQVETYNSGISAYQDAFSDIVEGDTSAYTINRFLVAFKFAKQACIRIHNTVYDLDQTTSATKDRIHDYVENLEKISI